jgi:4-methyl-5(b-hydroxyethyl)-thiazole monophosphate biosynthesis
MAKRLLLLLGEGFEETEVVVPVDILRRAGVEVTLAAVGDESLVEGAHGLTIRSDASAEEISMNDLEAILIPGGPAVFELRRDQRVLDLIRRAVEEEKLVAAICAAPLLLQDIGALEGKRFTAHPSVWAELPRVDSQNNLVEDGNLITASGPGVAAKFAWAIARRMVGKEAAEKVWMTMGW